MNLNARLRALAKRADHVVQTRPVAAKGVCARIEELTRHYAEGPPVFRSEIEAGIAAGIARTEQLEVDDPLEGASPRVGNLSGCRVVIGLRLFSFFRLPFLLLLLH
jgi:hypothetical protein